MSNMKKGGVLTKSRHLFRIDGVIDGSRLNYPDRSSAARAVETFFSEKRKCNVPQNTDVLLTRLAMSDGHPVCFEHKNIWDAFWKLKKRRN